ncbi:MAG: L-threonylcarbamoyladenylate synthase [Chloroflexota bacterium]
MKARVLLASSDLTVPLGVACLRTGGLVVFPTDTVYGVGVHGFLPDAVERLYSAKIRPRRKAIPLLLAEAQDLELIAQDIPDAAWKLIRRFWPGGLTLVLRARESVPTVVRAGGNTVAARVPDYPLVRELIRALGAPVAATSANLSGRRSPRTAQEAMEELGDRVDLYIDGGECPGGIESTVIDMTGRVPVVLRHGAIPEETLRETIAF